MLTPILHVLYMSEIHRLGPRPLRYQATELVVIKFSVQFFFASSQSSLHCL
jgi:hypothetical protein